MSPTSSYTHSIAQFAAEKGVTPRTVRNWIAAGHVKAVRIGPRLVRIDPETLAARSIGGAA